MRSKSVSNIRIDPMTAADWPEVRLIYAQGIATGDATLEQVLKNADIAMYRAKDSGRNRVVFFEPEMNARMEKALLERKLAELQKERK